MPCFCNFLFAPGVCAFLDLGPHLGMRDHGMAVLTRKSLNMSWAWWGIKEVLKRNVVMMGVSCGCIEWVFWLCTVPIRCPCKHVSWGFSLWGIKLNRSRKLSFTICYSWDETWSQVAWLHPFCQHHSNSPIAFTTVLIIPNPPTHSILHPSLTLFLHLSSCSINHSSHPSTLIFVPIKPIHPTFAWPCMATQAFANVSTIHLHPTCSIMPITMPVTIPTPKLTTSSFLTFHAYHHIFNTL